MNGAVRNIIVPFFFKSDVPRVIFGKFRVRFWWVLESTSLEVKICRSNKENESDVGVPCLGNSVKNCESVSCFADRILTWPILSRIVFVCLFRGSVTQFAFGDWIKRVFDVSYLNKYMALRSPILYVTITSFILRNFTRRDTVSVNRYARYNSVFNLNNRLVVRWNIIVWIFFIHSNTVRRSGVSWPFALLRF